MSQYLRHPCPVHVHILSRAAQTSGCSSPLPGQTFKLAILIVINVTNRSIRITFLSTSSQPVFAFSLSTPDATKLNFKAHVWILLALDEFKLILIADTITDNGTWPQPSEHQILRPGLSHEDFLAFLLLLH